MDVSAIQAAAAATTATYRSFADATRSVLALLEDRRSRHDRRRSKTRGTDEKAPARQCSRGSELIHIAHLCVSEGGG